MTRCLIPLLWFGVGCSLEAPEAPTYETDIFIPLGQERFSGLDLLEDSPYLEGDSTGTEPLQFQLTGSIEDFRMEKLLDLSLPTTSFSVSLRTIEIDPPREVDEAFSLEQLSRFDLPPKGTSIPIPSFRFEDLSRALATQESFQWLKLESGQIQLTLTNLLPIPLGSDPDQEPSFSLRLRNRETGTIALEIDFEEPLTPGDSTSRVLSLDGTIFEQELDLEIDGRSPGSDGKEVLLLPDQALLVRASFSEISPDSVVAVVPPQSLVLNGTFALSSGDRVAIQSGDLIDGSLPIVIENHLPLQCNGRLVLSEFTRGAEPLALEIALPPGVRGRPGFYLGAIDFTGVSFEVVGEEPRPDFRYSFEAVTTGSAGPVGLSKRQEVQATFSEGEVRFEQVAGTMERRRVDVPRSETRIDPPEGLEDFEFIQASLRLEVENGVELPAQAHLLLEGLPEEGGAPISLPLEFPIAPAVGGVPTTSVHVVDQTDTAILELIASRPRILAVSGSLEVGEGRKVVTVRRSNRVGGRYTVSAPLHARIGRIQHRSDPFDFQISNENQQRIQEDLIEAHAQGTIENHFPAALTVGFAFAGSEAELDSPPVGLSPIRVESGRIDEATGRVVEARTSSFEIQIPPEDLEFFARDRVWGRIELTVEGEESQLVEVTARDYVQALAMLRFRARVAP